MIPALKISIDEEQRRWILERIDECLMNGQLVQGKYVKQLEEKFARYAGVKHAIAVNSGTGAMEIVMRILGVEGKEVIIPTNTFCATATGVLFAGGRVNFADVDPETLSVSLEAIQRRVTEDTAGVVIVHIGGIIAPEIVKIQKWCEENNLWLYEDAAHAHGCWLNGKHAGTFGIAGSFSFFATKVMTSGEGGMIVTNDSEIARKAALYRNHGKPEPWVSYHVLAGSNWRMNEIAAIIGLAQLDRLERMIEKRQEIARQYNSFIYKRLPDIKIIVPQNKTNWYKYILVLPSGIDRETLKQKMAEKGIKMQGEVYGLPLHNQPIFKDLALAESFPVADDICRRHICLPLYTELTRGQVDTVCLALESVLTEMRLENNIVDDRNEELA
jgi:perosamine synthetase